MTQEESEPEPEKKSGSGTTEAEPDTKEEQVKPEKPKEAEQGVVGLDNDSAVPLVLALFVLGTLMGATTGASVAEGISKTFLSSFLTFVAGSILTFAGFRVQLRAGDTIRVSPARVGYALLFLCLGTWVGLGAGVYGKIRWIEWSEKVEAEARASNRLTPTAPAVSASVPTTGGAVAPSSPAAPTGGDSPTSEGAENASKPVKHAVHGIVLPGLLQVDDKKRGK